MRDLDNAAGDQPGQLDGYEPPYHDFNGITSKFGAHFILRVDRILMKKQYSDAIINGVQARDFPPLPVVLKGCVSWAKENGVELVTAEHMKIINDKRSKEKSKK